MMQNITSNFTVWLMLLLSWLLVFNACGTSKRTEGSTLKKKSLKFVENQLERNLFDADWLRMKAKITANDGKQKQSFNADVRLRKDSVLWMSISPTILKIEVARVLISRDSVQVIDRIHKQYYATNVDFLETLTNYPLNFEMLQNILFGNPIVKGDTKSVLSITKENYCLQNALQDLALELCLDPKNFTLAQMSVNDTLHQRYLNVALEDYEAVDKQIFSHKRLLSIEAPQKYEVDIRLSKVKANEAQKVEFSVPEKYEKVERLEIN
ncbi:MAG: DUF4292 domain-containing protein [Chitinophagales bacterium]